MRFIPAAGVGILTLSVCVALGGAGAPKREDVPKYMSMLKSPSGKDRAIAAEMLGRRGQVAYKDVEKAIEPLKQTLLKDTDANARKAAATALGSIRPEAAEAVPELIQAVKKDASVDVKVAAAESLGVFKEDAKEGVPAIRELMKNFNDKAGQATRKRLQAALANITGAKKKKD
jgi:HEAT repeat protein